MKSVKVAYFLLLFFGLQGLHQFYLGNWRRGLGIAALTHLPVFWFAYLTDQVQKTGVEMALLPQFIIFFSLVCGLLMVLWDLFSLRRQAGG